MRWCLAHCNCQIYVSLLILFLLFLLAPLTSRVILNKFFSLLEPQLPHGIRWKESVSLPALLWRWNGYTSALLLTCNCRQVLPLSEPQSPHMFRGTHDLGLIRGGRIRNKHSSLVPDQECHGLWRDLGWTLGGGARGSPRRRNLRRSP